MAWPTLAAEIVHAEVMAKHSLPFRSWAMEHRFDVPTGCWDMLSKTQSGAEAYFVRAFLRRPSIHFDEDGRAHCGDLTLELQVPARGYSIDAVVTYRDFRLAVEIDGIAFHHQTAEQVAADYLRERRLVLQGYTVIRFTAREAVSDASECWRQIDAILTARGGAQ